jgi:hypothetical protein
MSSGTAGEIKACLELAGRVGAGNSSLDKHVPFQQSRKGNASHLMGPAFGSFSLILGGVHLTPLQPNLAMSARSIAVYSRRHKTPLSPIRLCATSRMPEWCPAET